MSLFGDLTAWIDIWWPISSGKYRSREQFRLGYPEERIPENALIPCAADIQAPVLARKTVRSTQPPGQRSVKGGRRK